MAVSLTPEQAKQKIELIRSERDQAVGKLNQISGVQEGMLKADWRGTYAAGYGKTSQLQREDADEIIRRLNLAVDKGEAQILSLVTMDNE